MTMAFLTMSMCEIFHSFNMRSQRRSVFSLPSHNKVLWLAMIGSLLLTTVVLEVPSSPTPRIYAGELDGVRDCAGSGGAGDPRGGDRKACQRAHGRRKKQL